MMNISKLFPKKNKKGMTLVEIVLGVVVLSIFTVGIITALVTASTTIKKKSADSVNHSQAVQMLDSIISTLSNGKFDGPPETVAGNVMSYLGYSDANLTLEEDKEDYDTPETTDDIVRGWIMHLEYNGVTVKGYASKSEGKFDKEVSVDDEEDEAEGAGGE